MNIFLLIILLLSLLFYLKKEFVNNKKIKMNFELNINGEKIQNIFMRVQLCLLFFVLCNLYF